MVRYFEITGSIQRKKVSVSVAWQVNEFQEDLWDGHITKLQFPELYSFTSNPNAGMHEVMQTKDFTRFFQLLVSEGAYDQLLQILASND